MKKKVLLFILASIGYAIILLIMGYDMGRKEVERREHGHRLVRLSMTSVFLDSVRAGDITEAESRLRMLAHVEAGDLLSGSWKHHALIIPLAQKLLKIGQAIPADEKSAAEQRWENRLKKKMQEKGKYIECPPDTLEHSDTRQSSESELIIP